MRPLPSLAVLALAAGGLNACASPAAPAIHRASAAPSPPLDRAYVPEPPGSLSERERVEWHERNRPQPTYRPEPEREVVVRERIVYRDAPAYPYGRPYYWGLPPLSLHLGYHRGHRSGWWWGVRQRYPWYWDAW